MSYTGVASYRRNLTGQRSKLTKKAYATFEVVDIEILDYLKRVSTDPKSMKDCGESTQPYGYKDIARFIDIPAGMPAKSCNAFYTIVLRRYNHNFSRIWVDVTP